MDAASDQFLATASFASNQDSLSVARDPLDHGHEALHRATGNDEFSAVDLASEPPPLLPMRPPPTPRIHF